MEKFVVLRDGAIFNLTTNKKLEVVIKSNNKMIDVSKMANTMSKSFSVMTRKEFIENWMLTLTLMLKNESVDDDNEYNAEIDDEFYKNTEEDDSDMELLSTSVTGNDITNYVTAFVLGRMLGKFEKNTTASVDIEEKEIDISEMLTIDKFIEDISGGDGAIDSTHGNGYFEFEDENDFWEDEHDFRE